MTVVAQQTQPSQIAMAANARRQIDAVVGDLARLEGIVNDAAFELLASFADIQHKLSVADPKWATSPISGAINRAITAMQFQDLASQLVISAKNQLNAAAHGLAGETSPPSPLLSPLKNAAHLPNTESAVKYLAAEQPMTEKTTLKQPVQQHDMNCGSVELF